MRALAHNLTLPVFRGVTAPGGTRRAGGGACGGGHAGLLREVRSEVVLCGAWQGAGMRRARAGWGRSSERSTERRRGPPPKEALRSGAARRGTVPRSASSGSPSSGETPCLAADDCGTVGGRPLRCGSSVPPEAAAAAAAAAFSACAQ